MTRAASAARGRPAGSTRRSACTPAARSARIVRAQTSSASRPSANSCVSPSTGTGRNCFSVCERLRVGAAVVEDAEDARQRRRCAASQLLEKRVDVRRVVVRDDLRQEELAGEVLVVEKADLRRRIGVRIGPAAEREIRHVLANRLAQLPRVRHAARRTDRPIAAEHDQRPEPFLPGALGVRQTELERVLRREERHDVIARHVRAEIDDEVAEVVLLARADGAVGEEHERLVAHEAA